MTFDDFWAAWPMHPRKGAKSECRKRWTSRGLDAEADHIVRHVQWLKSTDQWQKDGGAYIPAPLVYLNGSRWDGAEIPESAEDAKARLAALEAKAVRESIERAGMAAAPVVRRVA